MDGKSLGDSMLTQEKARQRWDRILNNRIILLFFLFLLFLIQVLDLISLSAQANGGNSLSVSIRAESQADYSHDWQTFNIPAISEQILNEIIQDLQGTGSAEDRMATLQSSLMSPVPTMTQSSQQNVQPTPTLVFPTSTSVSISPTPDASVAPPATATLYPTSTPTFVPANTNTPYDPPPSPTPVPQKTKKPHPTQRPKPTKKP